MAIGIAIVVIEVVVFSIIMGDLIDDDSALAKIGGKVGEIAQAVLEGYMNGLRGESEGENVKALNAETGKSSGECAGANKRKSIIDDQCGGDAGKFDAWLKTNEKQVSAQSRGAVWQSVILPVWEKQAAHQVNAVSVMDMFCRNTLDRLQTSWILIVGSTAPMSISPAFTTAWRAQTKDLYLSAFEADDRTPEDERYNNLCNGFW